MRLPRAVAPVMAAATVTVGTLPALATAQPEPSAGEELYMEVFGCWTCHGRAGVGAGGEGQPLQGTYLPLSLFVKELRLPAATMPPYSPLLATDDELAVVYAWLEGADPVQAPPPVTFTLEGFEQLEADVEGEVGFTAHPATSGADGGSTLSSVRFRVTLFRQDNGLVGGLPLLVSPATSGDWASVATDPYGQLVVGPEEGSALALAAGATVRVRIALPAGKYAFVVEAVDSADSDDPTIFGLGTAVIDTDTNPER